MQGRQAVALHAQQRERGERPQRAHILQPVARQVQPLQPPAAGQRP